MIQYLRLEDAFMQLIVNSETSPPLQTLNVLSNYPKQFTQQSIYI